MAVNFLLETPPTEGVIRFSRRDSAGEREAYPGRRSGSLLLLR